MKRLFIVALSVLMLASMMLTTVYATTGGAEAVASVSVAKPGDTVEVVLSVYGYESVTNVGFAYDVPAGLRLESAQWLLDGDIQSVDTTVSRAAFATATPINMTEKTPVFKFVFTVTMPPSNQNGIAFTVSRMSVEDNYQLIPQNVQTVNIEVSVKAGDMNGDQKVNDSDAMYLLRYTLFGSDRYPVPEGISADVNNDGAVNDADALYLLRHTLFPNRFPLYPVV